MLKKLILASAALAIAVPAFADNGYHRGPRDRVVQARHVVFYRPAPRPVYVVHRYDPVPLLFGAIIGAAVVHSVLSR